MGDSDIPSATQAILDIRGVSKTYKSAKSSSASDVIALLPVDLQVEAGDFVALVGPSGCGKSTLLNLAGGMLAPTDGEVVFAGRALRKPDRRIGIMFQSPVLFPWRTIRKNIELPAEIRRATTPEFRERVDRVLALVGLEDFAENHPQHLSGGMQQRASLARVLAQDPTLLLMDEPFSALDEFTRETMNVELARIVRDAGVAVMFVTHNITEAIFLADRVVVMSPRPGRVVGVLDVPFERPRSLSILRESEVTELVFEVRQMLGENLP